VIENRHRTRLLVPQVWQTGLTPVRGDLQLAQVAGQYLANRLNAGSRSSSQFVDRSGRLPDNRSGDSPDRRRPFDV
jgi:hypothetical protein